MVAEKARRIVALTPEKAYTQAATRCAQREYCRADWSQKWLRAGLSAEAVEKVLMQLEREGFIDENRYARAFVHDKFNYDHWGRMKMRAALQQKGLSASDITEALSTIDEDAYREMLQSVLAAKGRTLRGVEGYERKQKLARFAAGRGFEASLVFRALDMADDEC